MASEHALHQCFTNFMLDTCLTGRENSDLPVHLCFGLGMLKATLSEVHGGAELFTSGSSAELYIKPMLSCVGDIDVMLSYTSCIAIPAGYRPPAKLPDHYQRVVTVYEIVNSHKPGYVYLQPSYILNRDNSGNYVAVRKENTSNMTGLWSLRMLNRMPVVEMLKNATTDMLQLHLPKNYKRHELTQWMQMYDLQNHGPAMTVRCGIPNKINENTDGVYCMRCLLWPPQASDWPKRYRNHGWPDPATISIVVNDGYDIVLAVHPSCRQDAWMFEHQWRLSFSRAEVTLLNSWSPVQQIIYHMLRFVMKREVLSKTSDSDSPKLSSYHLKTLLLWECEQKSQTWWSVESSFVKICSSLLHKLSDLVRNKRCQHYFLDNCNLLDHLDDASLAICGRLNHLADASVLLGWFVENYMRQCARCCSEEVSTLFEYARSNSELDIAAQGIVEWIWIRAPFDVLRNHASVEIGMHFFIHMFGVCFHAKWTSAITKELQNVDLCYRDYFIAAESLQIAHTVSIHSLTPHILEVLWSLFGLGTTAANNYSGITECESGGVLSIRKAIKLARLSSVCSNALDMLRNEMAKAYLHHSFTYQQETTYCVVHVLLAILYYKSGHYQEAIQHCKQVMNECDNQRFGLRSFGVEYLPQIDENVDTVFGLILLYQHFQTNILHLNQHSQLQSKLPFTTKFLMHYLQSTFVSEENAVHNEVKVYQQCLLEAEVPHVIDILLFKVMEKRLHVNKNTKMAIGTVARDSVNDCTGSMDTELLVTTLELVALEKLIAARQLIVRELYSEHCPVVNEFEALYAYKCGLFEYCLEICRNNVNLLHHSNYWMLQYYWIAVPEMLSITDGELVSLVGIVRLMGFSCLRQHARYSGISLVTLYLYLMGQCQKKLGRLDDTTQWLRFVHDEVIPANCVLDRLILKMTYRSLKLHFNDLVCRST